MSEVLLNKNVNNINKIKNVSSYIASYTIPLIAIILLDETAGKLLFGFVPLIIVFTADLLYFKRAMKGVSYK